jgi:hypothetical protein
MGRQRNLLISVADFVLFLFVANLDPNSQTSLLAGEVFPSRVREPGTGPAAAIEKRAQCRKRVSLPPSWPSGAPSDFCFCWVNAPRIAPSRATAIAGRVAVGDDRLGRI